MQFTQGQIVRCKSCIENRHAMQCHHGQIVQSLGNDMYLVDWGFTEPDITSGAELLPEKEHHA